MKRKVERALLSAFCKDGVVEFARFLVSCGVEILSTGGTAKALREAKVPVRDVAEVTEYPEMMGGRVKTLHPRIHGGLLFRREDAEHRKAAETHGIPAIDLLYVDLYPFEEVVARDGAANDEIIEMIDIGGPAMIRSSAKNHEDVLVLVDPRDLPLAQQELSENEGATLSAFRRRMAAKAFRRTAAYDSEIASYLTEERFPERLTVALSLVMKGRYGENPHQEGAVYRHAASQGNTVAAAHVLGGKQLSYNNFLDASAAYGVVRDLEQPAATVIKHRNPCGAAVATSIGDAVDRALLGDTTSAFGGILAINRPLTGELCRRLATPELFLEVIVSPRVDPSAQSIFESFGKWGKNVRILEVGEGMPKKQRPLELRSIDGGVLVQEEDSICEEKFEVVSDRQPTDAEWRDLRLANILARHVTSNAITLVRGQELVGAGAGQMSRVDSVHMAVRKSEGRCVGAVMGSDAFFPFPDGVLMAAEQGVTAVIQPGGSIRDRDVLKVVNERGMAMVLTHRRHFRH
ncbi:MAG TPA: bifunctional phosphoribosylaminoimidazolecarboxamide formyltransferase/IMP cyclohydrolase [Planctomycetota bacterium]|jgi:phosphoribosylaminoimidazolecarboxamide formyltransferase/IMP cyclohydrolase|nr:bifunctional phosphoribosylaminoimidazolecarboxamide formyltransferase/IMP cyclohydrolase [Planctomycetota bacterium]